MSYLNDALAEISEQQQKMEEHSQPWCLGEQLKDILRGAPAAAEIVLQDLKAGGMRLTDCEKKIEEFASKHRKGNTGCCPPHEADRIIREFYGIPAGAQEIGAPEGRKKAKKINLADFL